MGGSADQEHYDFIQHHDAAQLPFADGSASIIYASHLLNYFDRGEAETVLAEWFRVLQPGG